MNIKNKNNFLWTHQTHLSVLIITAIILLFGALGGREVWTQEWRWADISWYMIYSGDYLHPMLAGASYYDKPLLSYWLMIFFAHLTGGLNEWSLRLPAACAGLLAVWSIYRIGSAVVNRTVGLMAGWMLVSAYFFLFWARTANADMLNLAGILLAIQWYFEHKDQPNFFNFLSFFIILAVTALFKGLIGFAIPILVLLPDLIQQQQWRKFFKPSLFFALLPAIGIYLIPFFASSYWGGQNYDENGLYEVYRENILRYFAPFDHQGPIYTYLIYLPLYILPWAIFFIPALYNLPKRWRYLNMGSRWIVWSTLLVFLFLTFSGSRRNYYVLPLVPFAILFTADWLAQQSENIKRYAFYILILALSACFLCFIIIQPLYYSQGGVRPFAQVIQKQAIKIKPWSEWNIIFLDARSKITLYLNPAHPIKLLGHPNISGKDRTDYTLEQLTKTWPIILNPPANTIFITRELYLSKLQPYFKNYQLVIAPLSLGERLLPEKDLDRPIAFIPRRGQA